MRIPYELRTFCGKNRVQNCGITVSSGLVWAELFFFRKWNFRHFFIYSQKIRGGNRREHLQTGSWKLLVPKNWFQAAKNIGTKIHMSETHFFRRWRISQKFFISSLQTKLMEGFESTRIFILLPYVIVC